MNYTLEGIDGNAFAVVGYVRRAMKEQGFTKAEIEDFNARAKSSDYNHLLRVSIEMIDECNERAENGHYGRA